MSSIRSHASRSRLGPCAAFRGQALTGFLVAAVALVPARMTGPKLGRLDFWRDVVPDDRLSARQEQP